MSEVKYILEFDWKEGLSINLGIVSNAIKALDVNYCGCSADNNLRFHFLEVVTPETLAAIEAYWDGITAESVEVTSYKSDAEIRAKIAELKAGILSKNWDVMSLAERKLVTNQSPTIEELFA